LLVIYQYVAVCCSVFQCVAVLLVIDQSLARIRVQVCCSVLQCVAVCCSVLQCAAVCCSVCCSVLQCNATRILSSGSDSSPYSRACTRVVLALIGVTRSADNATPTKSTISRNLYSPVNIRIQLKSQFGFVPRNTERILVEH